VYDRHADMKLFPAETRKWILDVCGADTPVDFAWKGGEVLDLGGRSVEVIHATGHTPGNLVFLDRQQGTLYECETILESATGEEGKKAVPTYCDVAGYRTTLHYLADLPWDLLASSHSMPRDRKAGLKMIRASLDFVDQFDEQLEAALKAQRAPVAFAALAGAVSKSYGYDLSLGLAILMDTHLAHLVKTRRATQHPDGCWSA